QRGAGYFSIDNGQTNLGNFNQQSVGDAGDWDLTGAPDGFNAFYTFAEYKDISQKDLREMDVLGYDRINDDYASDTNFAFNLLDVASVNNPSASITGSLEQVGDHDWFRVQLVAQRTYIIDERGSPSGGGTLSDPFLELHDSSGAVVASDDDSGV